MIGFILAAGFGTRLAPLTEYIPKPLLPVWGFPMICYPLVLMRQAGIEKLIINVHHHADQIITFFTKNNNFGFEIYFSKEEKILGTGGGIGRCLDQIGDDDLLLINGDIIFAVDPKPALETYFQQMMDGMLFIRPVTELKNPPEIEIEKPNSPAPTGKIRDINGKLAIDKTISPLVVNNPQYRYTGMAILGKKAREKLTSEFCSLVDNSFVPLAEQGLLDYFLANDYWADGGELHRYHEINLSEKNEYLANKVAGLFSENISAKVISEIIPKKYPNIIFEKNHLVLEISENDRKIFTLS